MLELNASILRRKKPIDGDHLLIASLLPGFDLPLEFGLIRNAMA